jgi:hypothetical protein
MQCDTHAAEDAYQQHLDDRRPGCADKAPKLHRGAQSHQQLTATTTGGHSSNGLFVLNSTHQPAEHDSSENAECRRLDCTRACA